LTKAFGVRRLDLTVYAFKSALILFIFKLFNDDYPLVKDKSILILGRLSSGSLKLLFLTTLVDLPCDCLRQRFMERLLIVAVRFLRYSRRTIRRSGIGSLPLFVLLSAGGLVGTFVVLVRIVIAVDVDGVDGPGDSK